MRGSQVGELHRRVMLKQRSLAFILILLLITMPWMAMLESEEDELKETNILSSGTLNGWPDVPTWRIGDKYTYETQFDVQQLIQQANVSASLNTLTGDTTYEVVDILFITIDGVQTLAYKMDVDGDFSSGNSGATLEGVSGKLQIGYTGEDLIRVRDLGVINSEFTLDVTFDPLNFGFLRQYIATISFDTSYTPAKEKYDFPLHTGDQWYMGFMASTDVSGSSDYFDPSEFDTAGYENNSWQITANGVPTESGNNIKYTGCDDSYKINEWNATGVSQGFNWYCPAVRYNSWMRVSNAAGFTIDWLLKSYQPAQSSGDVAGSNPGTRDLEIEIGLQGIATLPDVEQAITIDYGGQQNNPQANTNLQMRYEMAGTLLNPTTDSNGQATEILNSSNVLDTTNSSDDYTSNGLIVWDPATEIIGATTIVIDLSLTPVDLIAQADAIIVTRIRDGNSQILTKSIGYNSLPGDLLSFSIPTQNRGLLSSPATEVEIITPDGTSIREPVPSIPSYGEARVVVNWTVPAAASIGIQTMSITVDPDETVTEDGNRSNNYAEVEIFVGRVPTAQITVTDGVYTFENVTLDASASFDADTGDVECRFAIEKKPGLIENIDSEDCWTQYNWSDGGIWSITLIVTDDELDTDEIDITAEVLNRAPYMNITIVDSFANEINSIGVNQFVKIDATDSGDIDTISPSGQQVTITWPGLNCQEGTTQPTCTFLASEEGMLDITAVAEDDDGATTTVSTTLDVLNVAPTLAQPELWYGGQNQSTDAMGYWNLYEDQTALLRVVADDTPLDKDTLIIEWMPSDRDVNWTESTVGPSSTATVSWPDSGLHNISVVVYDNDNSQSQIRTGIVNITNVPPTIESLGSTQPIFEDDDLTFTAIVSDTASDVDSLIVCWDLSPMVDTDSDGISDNDCDETGLELTASWPNMGIRQITATVTDDDGASASTSVNVSVLNISPKSKITNETDVLALNEGDNVTLSGITSTETPSDKLNLIYAWDSDHLDSDLDGENTGEVDFYGVEYTIEDLPAGNWIVTLTVTDDDGESTSTTIELSVAEKPADNFLESITDTVGGVGSVVIIILLIVVVGLAAFLLLTRKSDPANDKYSDLNQIIGTQGSQFSEPIPAQTYQQTEYGAYDQPTQSQPVAQDPYAAYNPAPTQAVAQDPYAAYNPAPTQPVAPQPVAVQPAVPQAPPIPATGLPQGWTMEQWQHYGAQYLAAQNAAPAPVQPTITDTRPATANSNLTDLLDDLDL
ncbi:MAG: hypothetical protein CBC92_006290 [Euryarchaeota archaeon TMED132]|nr:hypothetical protein [Euryarchaeota archaeon]RAH05072.1 MAG: hypothetical protein CBC92_006290 [Euryarchaeota archaeon TMED132]